MKEIWSLLGNHHEPKLTHHNCGRSFSFDWNGPINSGTAAPGQSSVSTEELLDENDHLALLNSSWVVLVESGENLIKGLIWEFITGSEITKGILDEFLGLLFVESTGFIGIISVPNLVNNTLNCLFLWSSHFWNNWLNKININKKNNLPNLKDGKNNRIKKDMNFFYIFIKWFCLFNYYVYLNFFWFWKKT